MDIRLYFGTMPLSINCKRFHVHVMYYKHSLQSGHSHKRPLPHFIWRHKEF